LIKELFQALLVVAILSLDFTLPLVPIAEHIENNSISACLITWSRHQQ
jgi:hypothetical protein